ncbi:MAG: hypothetical protein JSW35_09660 [Deltaproteobacteria bacterium]|nr:MAG: hypothetical protein JSW35_09660 [Deltaproteobacteria bacterium]
MIPRYIIAWIGLAIIGIINGVIREVGYGKFLGELLAHQVSSVTGIILFGLFTWCLSLRWRMQSSGQAFTIGIIWLALTIAFEFLFGHYVMKHPWPRLLHDYNILEGRLWLLVLVWIPIAPYVVYKLRS